MVTAIITANAQEILDTAYIEFSYKFTQMIDTISEKKSTRDSDMRLLVGNKYSKFYSHNLFMADSVFKSMTEAEQRAMLQYDFTSFVKKYSSTEGYKVYINNLEKQIIVTDIVRQNIVYREPLSKQNWNILDEKKELLGYKCQKATCRFRGRNYVAWFTRDIPIDKGPWKFNGLPGLIVKVYDTQEHFDFELVEVNKTKRKITYNEKSFGEVSLKDYIKICRRRIQYPLEYLMSKGRNVQTSFSPDPKQYDVMERDIK
jgi:GLPGLI family protein